MTAYFRKLIASNYTVSAFILVIFISCTFASLKRSPANDPFISCAVIGSFDLVDQRTGMLNNVTDSIIIVYYQDKLILKKSRKTEEYATYINPDKHTSEEKLVNSSIDCWYTIKRILS